MIKQADPEQRVGYYKAVCTSLNLNPLTKPFSYITLNGKLTLYANKDAADQLRNLKNISIDKPEITFQEDWIIVTVVGYDGTGRKDSDVGVVNKKDMRGDFGNALMKAVTKAKRRLTLSICGLGMLDETEIETIPTAKPVVMNLDTGEMADEPVEPEQPPMLNPYKKFNITLTQAQNVTGSDGLKYGDVTEKDLNGKRIGIVRKLGIKNLTAEEKDELLYKVEAIDVLLDDLAKATQAG